MPNPSFLEDLDAISYEEMMRLLKEGKTDQVNTGVLVVSDLPVVDEYEDLEHVVMFVLGVGMNPNPEDYEAGNKNFVDMMLYDYDFAYFAGYNKDCYSKERNTEITYTQAHFRRKLQQNVLKKLPAEITDHIMERKILVPYKWECGVPIRYHWKSIGKVWIPSLTELSFKNLDPDCTDQGEVSYFEHDKVKDNPQLVCALTRTKSFSGEVFEIRDYVYENEDDEEGDPLISRWSERIPVNQKSDIYPCIRLRF